MNPVKIWNWTLSMWEKYAKSTGLTLLLLGFVAGVIFG